MQPKRDPSDRRFWPVRLGGTSGFSDYHKQGKPSPYRYGSLSKRGSLSDNPNRLRVTARPASNDLPPLDTEALRAKARLVSLKLLEETEDRASSMDDGDLVSALGQALKASGAIATSVDHKHSHRLLSGEERERRAAEIIQRVQARLLIEVGNGTPDDTLPSESDAIPLPDNEIG